MPLSLHQGPSITARSQAIAPVALFVIAFIIGCHYYGPGINLSFLLYSWVALIAAFGWVAFTQDVDQLITKPVLAGLGVIGLIFVHHLVFSVSPDSSFAASVALAGLPLAFILSQWVNRERLFLCLFRIATLIALYSSTMWLVAGSRASLPFADPNTLVAVMYLAWLPWLHGQLQKSAVDTWTYVFVAGLTFAFVVALLATASRFAALVVVGALFWFWITVPRLKRRSSYLLLGAVTLACGVAWLAVDMPWAQAGGNEATSVALNVATEAESHRWVMLDTASQLIVSDGGLFGTGLYTFSLLYPSVRPLADQSSQGIFVHNDYAQLFLEGGVILTLPLFVLMLWLARNFLTLALKREFWAPQMGHLIAAGVLLVHAFVNFTFYIFPLALFFGITLACTRAKQADAKIVSTPQYAKAGVLGLWLLMVVAGGYLAVDSMTYAVFSGQKGMPLAQRYAADLDSQVRYAEFARAINSDRGVPILALARAEAHGVDAQNPAAIASVAARFDEAVATDPWNPVAHLSRAKFLLAHLPERQYEVETSLARAHQLDPVSVDAGLTLLNFYLSQGREDEAVQVAATLTNWCELIARRDVSMLDQLGRTVSAGNKTWRVPALDIALDRCRQHMTATRGTEREASWLLKWLGV